MNPREWIDDISNWSIEEKILRGNRYWVKIGSGAKSLTIPHANYIWLKGNPSFKTIPHDYVIHHLDLDPMNDDISNLALMHKNHHTAHHMKYINSTVQIKVERIEIPTRMPKAYKNRDRWILQFSVKIDGKSERRKVASYSGKGFKTEAEAKKAIPLIWPNVSWDK